MDQCGMALDQSGTDVSTLFDQIDTDKNNLIEFSEFATAGMERLLQLSDMNLQMAFNTLAENDVITKHRLLAAFNQSKVALAPEDEDFVWQDLIDQCSECSDTINY